MKLLVIGNASSVWIQKLVKNVYLRISDDITIVTESNAEYSDFYINNNIKVNVLKFNKNIMKIPGVRKIYYRKKYWDEIKNKMYDSAHINFLNVNNTWLASKISKNTGTNVVATYWGSDLLDVDKKYLKKEFEYLNDINTITVSTNYMMKYIEKNITNFRMEKVKEVKFGAELFSLLDKQTTPLIDNSEKKILIAIGYNGRRRQNHIPVIEELRKLPNDVKKRIHIILQMSYAIDDDMYLADVKKCLMNINIKYTILQNPLNDVELASLRSQVDIFIHAQKTDAFSASVMEYLYSNTLVLNPDWIRYEELIEHNVEFFEYHSFDEIQDKIIMLINRLEQGRISDNKQKLHNIMSWEKVSKDWIEILQQ